MSMYDVCTREKSTADRTTLVDGAICAAYHSFSVPARQMRDMGIPSFFTWSLPNHMDLYLPASEEIMPSSSMRGAQFSVCTSFPWVNASPRDPLFARGSLFGA